MVAESWLRSLWKTKRKNGSETVKPEKLVIGILSFEVASLLSKVIHLWRSLDDDQIVQLREEIMGSIGIRKLVSDDDEYLHGLVCAEAIENLKLLVSSVGRIGKKCADPVLQRFEIVFDDMFKSGADSCGWEFTWKKMDKKVKKFEKYIRTTANLYQEMQALTDLELAMRKVQGIIDVKSGDRSEYQMITWKRHEVKHLREVSLWNKTYDYVVLVLARSIFTLLRRINHVFGIHETVIGDISDMKHMNTDHLPRSRSISALRQMSVHPAENDIPRFSSGPLSRSSTKSGPFGRSTTKSGPLETSTTKSGPLGKSTTKSGPLGTSATKSGPISQTQFHSGNLFGKPPHLKTKRFTPAGPFKGCIMGGNKSPVLHSYAPVVSGYMSSDSVYSGSLSGAKGAYLEQLAHANIRHANLLRYSSKTGSLAAPPSTLGAAALALHYAEVIIEIEKYVDSPHLLGPKAGDELYSMLPSSIKAALRSRLKSYGSNLASSYSDSDLAAEWSEAVARIIDWLSPLAHNMSRWQSERSFQQQHMMSRTSVLLVQTLFFANQAKTEAAITEILVGLNYLWRFSRELNEKALRECSSSIGSDDSLDFVG